MLSRRAFTMVELLVAVGITALMFLLISNIFSSTSRGVSAGVGLGKIIEQARAIDEQIQRDAEAMLGPNAAPNTPAGFIVITNRRLAGQKFQMGDGSQYTAEVRDDQLVFITQDTSGFKSLTPATEGSFSSSITGTYARVWYGHAVRTNQDGSDADDDLTGEANKWILARQALLMDASATPTIHVNGVLANSPVVGYAAAPLPPSSPNNFNYHGLSDVSNQTLAGVLLVLAPGYPTAAYDHTFTQQDVPQNKRRLRCNPNLGADLGTYQSWQISQQAMGLSVGASDFEVSFSADLDGDGAPDDDIPGAVLGNLIWYGLDTPDTTFTAASFTPYDATATLSYADRAFVFQHTDDGSTSKWPYLLRIRYRLHDPKSNVTSTKIDAANPDGLAIPGKWFEQIIKVRRP